MTRREVEWTDDEQQIMLALAAYRALRCDGCGGWLPDTLDTVADNYVLSKPHKCGQCVALGIEAKARSGGDEFVHLARFQARYVEEDGDG